MEKPTKYFKCVTVQTNELIESEKEVTEEGTIYWFNWSDPSEGILHRRDGPAIEHADGHTEWWFNGKLHREDGPATEYPNGYKEWWLENKLQKVQFPSGKECIINYSNGHASSIIDFKNDTVIYKFKKDCYDYENEYTTTWM